MSTWWMMKMPKVKLNVIKSVFNDAYLPYLVDDTRTQIFYGGSSSGKSYFLAQRAILDVAQGGRNYLIDRNVANTIRKSVFNEITKAITFFKLGRYFNINKSDMIITCANGYQILFAGLDDTEKIKSITPAKGVITDIWVEEATETEYAKIKQLNKRLRGRSRAKKRLMLSFNPILQSHWIYKEYFSNWDDSKKEYRDKQLAILKTTYKDNRFLTPEDIYDLEHETDKYYYEVYTLGNWGVIGAVIFKNWRVEDLTEIKKIASNHKNGLDFGYARDPAAMLHTHYDRVRKTIYILDELYGTGMTNDILAEEIKKIIENQYVTCDSEDPKSIAELRQYGVKALAAKKGPGSVNHGIQWLQQQTIIIDVKCQNFRNEIQQYKWKEDKDGNVLTVPVSKNDHLLDALRYAYEDEFIARRTRNYSGKGARG
jgi:phage terminase large subunit